jgi:hypothetical protein
MTRIHIREEEVLDHISFINNILDTNLKTPPKGNNQISDFYKYQSADPTLSIIPESPVLVEAHKPKDNSPLKVHVESKPLPPLAFGSKIHTDTVKSFDDVTASAIFKINNPDMLTSKEKEQLKREAKADLKSSVIKVNASNLKLSSPSNITGKLHNLINATDDAKSKLRITAGDINYDGYHSFKKLIEPKLSNGQKLTGEEAKFINLFAVGDNLSSRSSVDKVNSVLKQIDNIIGPERKPIIIRNASSKAPNFGAKLQTLDSINQTISSNSAAISQKSPLENFLNTNQSKDGGGDY